MIINKPKDLVYPIEFLIDSNGYKIRVQDCNKFSCKFFTTNEDNYIESSFIDGELTNLVLNEDEDLALINSSDLELLENGSIRALIQYSIEDVNYEDGMFDNNMYQTTNFILAIKTSGGGSTGDTYTKFEIDSKLKKKLDIEVYNQDKETFATKEELSTKQDTLISGTNIKTINGNSLLGEGDITIEVSGGTDLSNYYNKGEVDGKLNDKLDKDTYESDKVNFVTKDEIPEEYQLPIASSTVLGGIKVGAGLTIGEDGLLSANGGGIADSVEWDNVQNKPTFATIATSGSYNDLENKPTIPTKVSELTNDSNYITNLEVDGKLATKVDVEVYNQDKANFASKNELENYLTIENAASTYQPKGEYLTEIPSEYITETELNSSISGKQDVLISGTNIKTINGNSLLGEGNIEIQGGGSGISDAPNDGKKYVRQNQNWVEETVIDTSSFAKKSEIPTNVSQLTNDSGYLTSIPTEYITEEELTSKDYATNASLSAKLDVTTYNDDKANFATKSEIPDVSNLATKEELGNYLTTENAASTYQVKGDYATNETVNGIEARLQTVETELSGATEITNNILQMI